MQRKREGDEVGERLERGFEWGERAMMQVRCIVRGEFEEVWAM